jgi:hypothetical protein
MVYCDMVPSAYVQGLASSLRFAMLKMDGRWAAGRILQSGNNLGKRSTAPEHHGGVAAP